MTLVLILYLCARVAFARYTLVRAARPSWGSIVTSLNQYRNGANHWVILMAPAFVCIMCHAIAGARKGETIIGCNMDRGARDAWVTETVSSLGVYGGR